MAVLAITLFLPQLGEAIVRFDGYVSTALHAHLSPTATAGFRLITALGSSTVLVVVAVVAAGYLFHRGRREDAALVALALAGGQVVTWSLKALFQRERPSFEDPVATASWFSFPSGHALTSLAVYGALAFVIVSGVRSSWARAAVLGGTAALVAAVGSSRVYLGVHYLSDVLAGYCAGLAWLLLSIEAVRAVSLRTLRRRVLAPAFGAASRLFLLAPLILVAAACGSSDEAATPPPFPRAEVPFGSYEG